MPPCIVTAEKNNKPTTTKTSDIAVFVYWIKSKNVYIGRKNKNENWNYWKEEN